MMDSFDTQMPKDDDSFVAGIEPVGVGVALPEQGMQVIEQPAKKRQKRWCTLCVQSGNPTCW
jgi:hypothetical protein